MDSDYEQSSSDSEFDFFPQFLAEIMHMSCVISIDIIDASKHLS